MPTSIPPEHETRLRALTERDPNETRGDMSRSPSSSSESSSVVAPQPPPSPAGPGLPGVHQATWHLLALLLLGDLAFIGLHCLLPLTAMDNPLYSLERDRGYAEFYQYLKELWIVALLVVLACRARVPGFAGWALAFAYLLVDDAFRLHEQFGLVLRDRIDLLPAWGVRARDIGETLVSLIAGLVIGPMLLVCYLRGRPSFRRASRQLAVLAGTVVFFGVAVDLLHARSAAGGGRVVPFLLGLVEDGGEMIAMSMIVSFVFLLLLRRGEPGFSLLEIVRRFGLRQRARAPAP